MVGDEAEVGPSLDALCMNLSTTLCKCGSTGIGASQTSAQIHIVFHTTLMAHSPFFPVPGPLQRKRAPREMSASHVPDYQDIPSSPRAATSDMTLTIDDTHESRLTKELLDGRGLSYGLDYQPGVHNGHPLLGVRSNGIWTVLHGYKEIARFLDRMHNV